MVLTPKEILILLLVAVPLLYLLLIILPVRFLYRFFKLRYQRRPARLLRVLSAVWGALYVLAISVIVFVPLYFYIPVEWRTLWHGREFAEMLDNRNAASELIYLRVFAYQGDSAKVLAVEGQDGKHATGNFYFFKRVDGKWRLEGGETVWTRSGGSANDITIPPYF